MIRSSIWKKNILFLFAPISLLFALFVFHGCNEKSHSETSYQKPLSQVTLSFDVFNHTQGYLTSMKRNIESGRQVVLEIADMEVQGVDETRMVIREGRIGSLTAFTKTGSAEFEAPAEDRQYTIYLMNASHGADYRVVDTWIGENEGILEYAPPLKWYREDRDGYNGPEDVIKDAVDLMNEALSYSWATYGSLRRIERRTNGSFGVGYGYCRNQFGWHNLYWAGVNPEYCDTSEERLSTFLEELFELISRLNDIGGKDTASLITDPVSGRLNEMGKDLLAYIFVKDEKL
jgi:hypothetical protein